MPTGKARFHNRKNQILSSSEMILGVDNTCRWSVSVFDMWIFSILGSNFQKFSNLQICERYSLKYYAQVLIGNSSEHRVLGTWIFFTVSRNQKKLKLGQKKSIFFLHLWRLFFYIQSASMLTPDSMLWKVHKRQNSDCLDIVTCNN